jgi:hypothetical protein
MKHTIVAWVRRGIAGGIALLPLGALAQTGENPALTGPMQSGTSGRAYY